MTTAISSWHAIRVLTSVLRTLTPLLLLIATGCTATSSRPTGPADKRPVAKTSMLDRASTRISAIMELNGETIAEIPLGDDDNVNLGYFYRIYDNESRDVKAILQVTELIGEDRAVGTVLHANADQDPISVGDRAVYLRDISTLFDARDTTTDARNAAAMLEDEQEATREEFAALRESYQSQLDAMHAEHAALVQRLRMNHATEIELLQKTIVSDKDRRDQERAADLAALNATFEQRIANEVRQRERLSRQHVQEITAERDRLRVQLDRLMKSSATQATEIKSLVQDNQQQQDRHRQLITAELEARQVLEERVRVLEAALRGESTQSRPILPNDLGRRETVLEHLQRIQQENVKLAATIEIINGDNETYRRQHEEMRIEYERMQAIVTELQGAADQLAGVTQANQEQANSLERLRAAHTALQKSSLIAEKNFYQLAKQILAVEATDSQLKELHFDVLHRLETMKNGAVAQ